MVVISLTLSAPDLQADELIKSTAIRHVEFIHERLFAGLRLSTFDHYRDMGANIIYTTDGAV